MSRSILHWCSTLCTLLCVGGHGSVRPSISCLALTGSALHCLAMSSYILQCCTPLCALAGVVRFALPFLAWHCRALPCTVLRGPITSCKVEQWALSCVVRRNSALPCSMLHCTAWLEFSSMACTALHSCFDMSCAVAARPLASVRILTLLLVREVIP